MQTKQIVGIDVSKDSFDAVIEQTGEHLVFTNNMQGFKKFTRWLDQRLSDVLVVMEHTGIYSFLLEKYLHQKGISFSKVAGIKIKKSAGLVRGKSDRTDAQMIARYGIEKMRELKPENAPNAVTTELKNLISLRDKMVRDRAGYIARWKEQKRFLGLSLQDTLIEAQVAIIKVYDKQIDKLEQKIREVIKGDEAIENNFHLLTSIKGVGPVIATYMIAFTENFTSFDTSRQFACYIGIAPFPYQSGTSIKGKTKVSTYAYKKLKALLHLSALTAIQYNPEMKTYYERRTDMGKNKMSTLNVVRNKIVSRLFAVVRKQTEYQAAMAA